MDKKTTITTQYNNKAEVYSKTFNNYNNSSIESFYDWLLDNYKGMRVLDIGCGDGVDIKELQKRSATVCGVDSSREMVDLARKNIKGVDVRNENFIKTSFDNSEFDWVVSKWAMQTYSSIDDVYREMVRVLKPNGIFLFLVTHPMRQFMEQKEYRDYFSNRLVESRLFENKVIVKEPNHTLTEYLSDYFWENFKILKVQEGIDEGAEVVNGEVYPSFLMIKAQKYHNSNLK